ncbi:uncharacterized protein LOC122509805 [Leptopilina heterotoma]|uniref:uncharacterized protein LOC122509805 n=1 Tax=Leptopilina heterotoma TaxID=63436 RepID=UPI001CA95B9F|nr:uncharacterized protein LOC122509805 [Leptopilina heterotoma]
MDELPIESLEDFLKFDEKLKNSTDLQDSLKTQILREIAGATNLRDAVKSIMPKIIKKDVQQKYSGKGKTIKGKGKLNFSKTNTFSCIKAATLFKLEETKENDLSSAIGIWLSQAGDREGGRKERVSTSKELPTENTNIEENQTEDGEITVEMNVDENV